MASIIDYNKLRAQTLGSGLDEEAVTVNTRALIDKVLARYSGEWTVLRELLQNAADASASRVTVRFETLPSSNIPVPNSNEQSSSLRHIVLHHTLRRLVVINNGQAFGANDWSRLKRIAEGNPDETKIGAFGVGFYSVFADCEEPFVSSGKEAMAFYWKGNSLFTRRLQLSEEHARAETSFVLDYREKSSPIPNLLSLCQFLANSLTFVGLGEIEMWLDEWCLLKLIKKGAPSDIIAPPRDIQTKTAEGMMTVTGVERQHVQIDADVLKIVAWRPSSDTFNIFNPHGETSSTTNGTPSLRSFFSRLTAGSSNDNSLRRKAAQEEKATQQALSEDLAGRSRTSVFLHITTASILTSVSASFAQELERATKKPPPKTTKLAILSSSHDEIIASRTDLDENPANKGVNVFSTVLPTKTGNIFIGFPTAQTTGLLAHVSAPSVIPTVERESIDLVNQKVKNWNMEMLRVAGIVSRIAWSSEMQNIKNKMSRNLQLSGRTKYSKEEVSKVVPETIHALKQFTFHDSTPSSQVGEIIEGAFWTCNKMVSIDIISSHGVLPSHEVRIATEDLNFVEGIPILPGAVIEGAKGFVAKLREFGLVTEITVSDIKKELGSKAMKDSQLVDFIRWAGQKASGGDINGATLSSLLNVAVATLEDGSAGEGHGQVIVLGNIRYFVNPSRIPADLPVPPNSMLYRFTRNIPGSHLEALGWEELQIVPWLRWLVEHSGAKKGSSTDHDLTENPSFAVKIFPVLSKQWDSLSQSSKTTVVELLTDRTVIPTKLGMKRPTEAYFPSVKIFDDLPTVSSLHSVKDKFLVALGVRKTIELGLVFERLLASPSRHDNALNSPGKWSHVDLIRYLASVRDDIPLDDIKRLKNTAICSVDSEHTANSEQRYKVSELFEPNESLRSLGLPILQWRGIYRSGSIEGKFLTTLGLRVEPTVPEMVEIIAKASSGNNPALRDRAMIYFISNHHINRYADFDTSSIKTPFLPLQGGSHIKLATPAGCFTNERAAVLGFPILTRDLQPHALKFGVMPDPPMAECITRLIGNPPKTKREAREVFSYFAGRLQDITPISVERLGNAGIVPIFSNAPRAADHPLEKSQAARYAAPKICFLGDSQIYGEIFDFIDFGQEANTFLLKCGSKHEPSKLEIAQMLVREPARLLSIFQTPDKYLALLRNLADSLEALKSNPTLYREMKSAPFLLAYRVVPSKRMQHQENQSLRNDALDDLDDEEAPGIKEWNLCTARQAVIVDEFISYSLFKDNLLAAPQEEMLEDFYHSLGTPLLSSLVQEQPRIGTLVQDQRTAVKLHKLVIERTRLFLHDYLQDSIKHNARWLEKNLAVKTVRAINLRRTLTGHNVSHVEKRTAAVTRDLHSSRKHTLWVSMGELDYFQVSEALLSLLLIRPKPHSAMMLETLLSTDLLKLRSRGYNVERILRQKAAEARIVEDQRQKKLEEERKQAQQVDHEKAELLMPGTFSDSPEQKTGSSDQEGTSVLGGRKPRGLFSSIRRRLFDDDDNDRGDRSPPHSPNPNHTNPSDQSVETITAPHRLHSNLLSAINASRAHDSSKVFSRPKTNVIKESASYCDQRPSQDLNFLATLPSGLMVFLSKEVINRASFVETYAYGLDVFSAILLECANVFGLPPKSLQIYYDEAGGTIAFNIRGSYFCNFRFFNELHLAGIEQGEKKADSVIFWWVTLCHELAHNIVPDHSAGHSYYTESFVMQYFPQMWMKVAPLYQSSAGPNSSTHGSAMSISRDLGVD